MTMVRAPFRPSERKKDAGGGCESETSACSENPKRVLFWSRFSCEITKISILRLHAFYALADFISVGARSQVWGPEREQCWLNASLCVAGWDWRWRRRPSLFPWFSHFSGGAADTCPQEQCQPVEENRSALFCQSFWVVLSVPRDTFRDFVLFCCPCPNNNGVTKVIYYCCFVYVFSWFQCVHYTTHPNLH